MPKILSKTGKTSPLLMVAIGFLAIVFLMGGGARQDIQSLILLRPIAAIVLATVIIKWPTTGPADNRYVRLVALACVAIAAIHLVPLPAALWSLFPGREIVARIDEAAGIAGTWRPIAMVPPAAWNALFALVVPAAALAVALRMNSEEHSRTATLFVVLGLASIVVGILQMLGGDGSPFYTYRIQSTGQLAGLFSNRNHHAIFLACLIPMIGFMAGRPIETVAKNRMRLAGLSLLMLFIVSAMVVTSSRAGAVIGLIGALAVVALYQPPKVSRRTHQHSVAQGMANLRRWRIGGFALVLLVAGLFYAFGSSAVAQRMAGTGGDEFRTQLWKPIIEAIWNYFPLGSGNGSFVEVYEIAEPTELLQRAYLNHAHNDWLEVALTLGLPGLAVVAGVGWVWFRASLTVFRSRVADDIVRLARVGSVIAAMLALASTVDYPLRTPSIACLFVFAMIWLSFGHARVRDRMREELNDVS